MAICRNKDYEREFVNIMTKLGVDSHRIAGSGAGKEAVCDCIISLGYKTYLVEVKATKEDKLYMRTNIVGQLRKMIEVCERNNYIPLLAIKFKYRGWNVLEVKNFENVCFIKEVILDENSGQNFIIA